MVSQVAVNYLPPFCIKVGQGNPIWGIWSQKPTKESEIVPAPLLKVPQETKLPNCHIYAKGLGQSYAGSMIIGSVSVSS